MTSPRDDYAADVLADADVVECRECAGRGDVGTYWGSSTIGYVTMLCRSCGGTGVWRSP